MSQRIVVYLRDGKPVAYTTAYDQSQTSKGISNCARRHGAVARCTGIMASDLPIKDEAQ